MRRRIYLYIADRLVDLDDQSFILFNYRMDDLSNPAVVRNSFSQQIVLKGTAANNKVFGHSSRPDRRITYFGGDAGTDFDPSQKTPFAIYDDMGRILESGYVKLDSVTRQGADTEYKVTLYGGLGSFFYSLSYDGDGNKRTLASLDYLGTPDTETELDFAITAQAVRDAWDRLDGDATRSAMWDVVNFAPAYNGIPEGNFAPGKGLVDPDEVGLEHPIDGHGPRSGYCLVNLAERQDEWAVKDLRSYLQRPVFSMRAFWEAVCNPANNGGYEVDASVILDYMTFGQYTDLWMTLPMISSLGTIKRETGDLTLSMSSSATSGNSVGRFDLSGSVPSGTMVTASLSCRLRFNMPAGASSHGRLLNAATETYGRDSHTRFNVVFVQAVARASDDSVVGGSVVKVFGASSRYGPAQAAQGCGYVPAWRGAGFEAVPGSAYDHVEDDVFELPAELGFSVEAQDAAYYEILVSAYPGTTRQTGGGGGSQAVTTYGGDGSASTPRMYVDFDDGYDASSAFIVQGASGNSASYASSETLRSGARITKAMLLSTSHTPAEYMLSFCKVFGLYFTYDNALRKVTVLRRNDLYQDETIDLTGRVDVSKGISIQPMVFDAKWYDFSLEGAGAFWDEYLDTEGVPYGIQRVNTGFDFNADSVDLMESVVFRDACTILGRSRYFNTIFDGQVFKPSPFLDKGNTYTLWNQDGETLETGISCPPASATVDYFNSDPAYKGYDVDSARKLELRGADGKPVDGSDILVFLEGWNSYPRFKLTDDVPAMDLLNEGTPCWLLGAGDGDLRAPTFQRYRYGGIQVVEHSLDFGTPRQLDIPGVRMADGSSLYEKGWRAYIADRYDVNTKVMVCKVDFSGIPVTQELLRKFYWYGNSLWVLNAIRNYSLTTYDPVECEFIQVQDKDHYLNGQTY